MRAQEIIRAVLDILDQADCPEEEQSLEQPNDTQEENRFKQVFDLISKDKEAILTNRPKEQYADVAAVTTDAGGGVNGPKHPHDMRGNSFSIYPNQQEY
jgi:hypothetical protein